MMIQTLVKQIELILDELSVAVTICDLNGNFVLINRAYEEIFGVKREDYLGKHVSTRSDPDEKSFHMMTLSTRRSCSGTRLLRTKSHNRYTIYVEAKPIIYESEMIGSIVTILDYERTNRMVNEMGETKRILSETKATDSQYSFDDIVGECAPMVRAIEMAKMLAATPITVLLRGESGTGKELFAHAIHKASERAGQPFYRINCASIAESLLESVLYGYKENSFTGARKGGQVGLFEAANHGTLFLDEIGEISLDMQVKLLRVLQEHEIIRVGDVKPIPVDVRIISATNADIEKKIVDGEFREDLYYRLNVFPVQIPPLRERGRDIRLLADKFVERTSHECSKNITGIEESYYQALENYKWPGNIRELENEIVRSILTCQGQVLTERDVSFQFREENRKTSAPAAETFWRPKVSANIEPYRIQFEEWEKEVCKAAYEASGYNKTQAAKALGISVRSFFEKVRKYGI